VATRSSIAPYSIRDACTGTCLLLSMVTADGRPEYCMAAVAQSPCIKNSNDEVLHSLTLPRPVVVTTRIALRVQAFMRSSSAMTASTTC